MQLCVRCGMWHRRNNDINADCRFAGDCMKLPQFVADKKRAKRLREILQSTFVPHHTGTRAHAHIDKGAPSTPHSRERRRRRRRREHNDDDDDDKRRVTDERAHWANWEPN